MTSLIMKKINKIWAFDSVTLWRVWRFSRSLIVLNVEGLCGIWKVCVWFLGNKFPVFWRILHYLHEYAIYNEKFIIYRFFRQELMLILTTSTETVCWTPTRTFLCQTLCLLLRFELIILSLAHINNYDYKKERMNACQLICCKNYFVLGINTSI